MTPIAFGCKRKPLGLHESELFAVQYFLWMLAVYASPPPSPAVDARLATGLRAADFPDRTFTGKSTSAFHGALRCSPTPKVSRDVDRYDGDSASQHEDRPPTLRTREIRAREIRAPDC